MSYIEYVLESSEGCLPQVYILWNGWDEGTIDHLKGS